MIKRLFSFLIAINAFILLSQPMEACTGITLKSQDGAHILARTIEWAGDNLNSRYVIVPRGYKQTSILPDGTRSGMEFTARYGYVGLSVEQEEFIADGLNEAGLCAGLFYFPKYGQYEEYNLSEKASTISDFQLVSWILGNFKTVDEIKEALPKIHVVNIEPKASTVHWRMSDSSGHQLVLEIIEGIPHFYENKLGVLTNAPGFIWQLTNLNNYVNLYPGTTEAHPFGNIQLSSFGAGSGLLGIPGDVTPPSRFVRAAFYQTTAPQQATARETVLQSLQILNNFDIPPGIEFPQGEAPASLPSATQWTISTDLTNRMIYYRTMYNSTIRCIDLKRIDFKHIKYHSAPLDKVKEQPIELISIK